MNKSGLSLVLLIISLLIAKTTHAGDHYYRYINDIATSMTISDSYIAVDIDPNNPPDWTTIYSIEESLDASEAPVLIWGDLYRLKLVVNSMDDALLGRLRLINGILDASPVFVDDNNANYYLGHLISLEFSQDASQSLIDSVLNKNQLQIVLNPTFARTYYLLDKPELIKTDLLDLCNELYESGYFSYVEPDIIVPISLYSTPNDPFFGLYQYYLDSSQTDFQGAFDYNMTDTLIKIAILDSGIEPHEDIATDRIMGGTNYILYDSLALRDQCLPGQEACFHGLAVAGTLAATINNDTGIAGAGTNGGIIMQKILKDTVLPLSIATQAFDDAADSIGANIISNSWGYYTCDIQNYGLYTLISYAVLNYGVFVVWGTGNCDGPPEEPQCGDCVLSPSFNPYV